MNWPWARLGDARADDARATGCRSPRAGPVHRAWLDDALMMSLAPRGKRHDEAIGFASLREQTPTGPRLPSAHGLRARVSFHFPPPVCRVHRSALVMPSQISANQSATNHAEASPAVPYRVLRGKYLKRRVQRLPRRVYSRIAPARWRVFPWTTSRTSDPPATPASVVL